MKNIILFLLFLSSGYSTVAQRYYVRKAIEKNYEKKYNEDKTKGENEVDKSLDKWDESDKKKRSEIEPFPTMSMTMQIEYPNKPKNNMTMEYYFKNYECASIFKNEDKNNSMDKTIMNFKEGKSTILMTDKKGKKTGMQMELKNFDWAIKNSLEKNNKMLEDGDITIKPTDEYKTIEGYKCRKYLYEDLNNTADMWICNSIGFDYLKYNNAVFSVFGANKSEHNNAYYKAGINGVVIQNHMMPKGGRGNETILTMKNIRANYAPDEMFSTAGYEITKMPSMRDLWNSAKEED